VIIEDFGIAGGWYWEAGSASNIGTVIVDGTPHGAAALPTANLTVTPAGWNTTVSSQLGVTWDCSGADATTLSWYLDDVYQPDLPLVGSGSIGPYPYKTYDGYNPQPYNVVVVAKTAGGKIVAQASFQFYVYR
jgi:hypothetical protein